MERKTVQKVIDEIVTADANDLSKWEPPIRVKPTRVIAFYLKPSAIENVKQ